MKVHEDLVHVGEYIEQRKALSLETFQPEFENILKRIEKFKPIEQETRMLEVGTGIGWFVILCNKNGIHCEGLEICPQFVDYARQLGRRYHVEPNIRLGNIEETDIGRSIYDVVVATSTFEHVEHWEKGIQRVFHALKPKGLFYFYSTNRFSLWSGECHIPFYSWLPDRWRYGLRIARHGEDIMKLGIDFNQFSPFQLKSFFKNVGFSRIFDQFEVLDSENVMHKKRWKEKVLKAIQVSSALKPVALLFSSGTLFICEK